MMQATTVPETSGLRRSAIARAIEDSADPGLLRSVIGLLELLGRAKRDEANTRMKVLGAVMDEPALGRDVATELGIDPSTVSRHIASLEAEGLIARHSDRGDRRAHPVIATEAGRSAYGATVRARLAAFTQATADWSPADRQQLAVLLGRLVADLDARRLSTQAGHSPAERNDA